jgi:hypothetical protein
MSATAFTHLVQRFSGTGVVRGFAAAPDRCPVCEHHVEPRPLVAHSTSPDDQLVDFVFQCPRPTCRRTFVGEYGREYGDAYALLAVAAPAFDAAHPAQAAPWLR